MQREISDSAQISIKPRQGRARPIPEKEAGESFKTVVSEEDD